MPYYGDGLPYYYGGAFATHSSLMTGAPRPRAKPRYKSQAPPIPSSIDPLAGRNLKKPPGKLPARFQNGSSTSYCSRRPFHTPLSRYSPHLSTITESPLSTLRRYSPVTVASRPRRVIDTADIDVSTPRVLSQDATHQRNRLRRDRPTIKIRSQALKDNPALREHHERHEKSVGELLVEKFLIKDKKLDETEKPLQLFHQVSLDREDEDSELIKNKITRRFTRRRSSADIQLDPEQIEREVAYAQVQAKVLDTLVAEEQAEIENAVRRGTLIKKGTAGGPRTVPGFFRNADGDAASVGEEEAAAQKMRKTLKKLKKKKKNTEKPPEDVNSSRERRSSTSSDVSGDLQASENDDGESGERSGPQMFKIEASNSVGDFSTIWVNSGVVEQFRESVKIPIPRKLQLLQAEKLDEEEESETEVVLPVRRPYVKDTSRNSVHVTVRTPPETSKNDPLKNLGKRREMVQDASKERDVELIPDCKDATDKISLKLKKEETQKAPKIKVQESPESPKSPTGLISRKIKSAGVKKLDDFEEESISTVKTPPETSKNDQLKNLGKRRELVQDASKERDVELIPDCKDATDKISLKLKKEETQKAPKVKVQESPESVKSPTGLISRKIKSAGVKKLDGFKEESISTVKRVEDSTATQSVDLVASENSDSVAALASAADGLPKASKINTDENNAVEAPKRSSREPEYLAKPTKVEPDEDVASSLPGKKVNNAVTLKNADEAFAPGERNGVGSPEESLKKPSASDDATDQRVTETTLLEGSKGEKRNLKSTKTIDEKAELTVKNGTGSEVKNKSGKVEKKGEEGSLKVAKKKTEIDNKPVLKKTENREPKIPWRNKISKVSDGDLPLNRSISVDSQLVSSKESTDSKLLKQTVSVDESLASKMPAEKPAINGDSGALSKSTSTESIDFWSEIKGPESPKVVAKMAKKGFGFASSSSSESGQAVEDLDEQLDKKKETDPKISVATASVELSNIPVIEEVWKPDVEQAKSESNASDSTAKKGFRKKKNLSIDIGQCSNETHSTVKKSPLKREDSETSIISTATVTNTPDTSVPVSEVSTPVSEISVPLINIVAATPTKLDTQILEDEDEAKTPTNEWPESKISKWANRGDLSNVDEKDVAPVPSKEASAICSPEGSPESSKKKKVVRKKKASATKKSSTKKESKKDGKESKKATAKPVENLKPPEAKNSAKTNQKNAPGSRPLDLMRMFYTTPSALLTATPRDLSKVRRAKIKRKKHHSRTPSMSSDSTGSTTSTATTESSGSTCTELDDDPEHKRMNSTRSNDSGFDGSPRISNCDMACHKKCEKLTGNLCGLNQKLVAEALQALRRAPSQSSDTQRNSDSSDHFPSGRITPPATNLPRFKKYAVTDFQFLKVLGKGSFGKVLLAELRGTECVYAVKCLKKDVVLEDDDVECTLIERKVLTLATRHPYLCHLFCTFQTDSHLFFVMEYLNGGDLMFHIQKSGRFPEPRARFYAAEIWSGLNFLHKKGIVYRDLKLDNVLLDFEGHIRIADFGMCKLQIFLDRTADTFCGTPDYMAPEIIKGLKYNQAVDWWSYGVLLYEMLTGQSPFSGCDEDELFWSICNERPFIPRYLSQDSMDILVALLEKDSGKRLPGHEIALHSFFQSLPWDRLERRQLEPPFKPALDHTLDTKYFDTAFTAERPRLTPVPEQIMTSMDQGVFRGFSYTNPNATD